MPDNLPPSQFSLLHPRKEVFQPRGEKDKHTAARLTPTVEPQKGLKTQADKLDTYHPSMIHVFAMQLPIHLQLYTK